MIRSSAGFEPLAGRTSVGTPCTGIPRNTVSTQPRLVAVAYFALYTSTQPLPHCGVAAPADSVPAPLSAPARVRTPAAASTLLLMDMTVPFVNHGRVLRTALLCARLPSGLEPVRAGVSAAARTRPGSRSRTARALPR